MAPRRSRGRPRRPPSLALSSSPASVQIPSLCLLTSARGRVELVVQQAFLGATIVLPGAGFCPGEALFGTFADLAGVLPVLPVIGGGHTRLQPVYVEDVAAAVAHILADQGTAGRTYELVGPGVYTLR